MDTHIATLVGVPTAFLITGYQFCLSQNPLPIIHGQPASVSAPIFAKIYDRGVIIAAPAAVIASSAFAYLAYTSRNSSQRRAYATAFTLSLSAVPWTRLVMYNGIGRLTEISKDSTLQHSAGQSGEVLRLLQAWTTQNWIRMGLNFGGAVAGLVAILM